MMKSIYLFAFYCLVIFVLNDAQYTLNEQKYVFSAPLDHNNKIRLDWFSDRKKNDYIEFKLSLSNMKMPFIIGFGFSNYGEFENADFYMIEVLNENDIKVADCYTDSNGILLKDDKKSYKFNSLSIVNNDVVLKFGRKLDTCDNQDYLIDTGTTHIIHFVLNKKYVSLNDLLDRTDFLPLNHSDSHDMIRVQLLKSNAISNDFKNNVLKNSEYFEIKNKNARIPGVDTTYWCLAHKLENRFKQKHHIVAFEGIIDERNVGIVHHMELFHCASDPTETMKTFSGVCTSEEKPRGLKQCRNVIAAWAMGASTFIYPDHVGGVIGGQDYSLYLVLEIHYDNQQLKQNMIDSSGMRIYYTGPDSDKMREYDAGIMEVGLEYNPKNSIPPKIENFNLHGYCLSECTNVGLPDNGITVFASQLHTHLTGRKVWTSVLRNGQVKEILNSDYHYSPMFQEIRFLDKPVQVMPGDTLVNTCEYNTRSRKNMTFGGFAITDEMCVNYMHYYPVSAIEVCKTSIRDDVLNQFFSDMKTIDYSPTSSNNSIKENFNSIRWTPLTATLLNKLYNLSPISFSCNSSDGENILEKLGYDLNQFKAVDMPQHDYGSSKRLCAKNLN